MDEFVDGNLSSDEADELRAHLGGCDGCRGEEREIRELLVRASSIAGEVAPERDLWPEIRDRIEGRSVAAFFGVAPWKTWGAIGAMAAAVLIVAVTATVFYRMGRGSAPGVETTAAIPASGRVVSSDTVQDEFEEARQELRGWLAQNRKSLPPDTLQRVEDNLRIIDDSVTDIRIALGQNPSSPELNRLLLAAYRREVELLQRVNAWYARM